jgi:hypothetical protein
MPEVVIRVSKEGKITVEAEGFVGAVCSLATEPFIRALGSVEKSEPKPELFQDGQVSQEVSQ